MMKLIYRCSFVALFAFAALLVSCSKDNDDIKSTPKEEQKEPEKFAKLKLSTTQLTIQLGNKATINILEGSGDYNCQMADTKVATAVLENNIITINSIAI